MKQWISKHLNVNSGANPLHNPSLKNKKAIYNCPVAGPKRGEACVNGFQVLSATTTTRLYQIISTRVNTPPKIF
jgi:hypothetical protein